MTDRALERKLAAILVADVVGYSRLMGADEVGTLATLTAHRRDFLDPTIGAYHGRIVKTTGDGFLLEFASVVDATRCAIALQRGMAARNKEIPQGQRLVFRMGVDIGDVIVQDGDIFGNGVNVAARLEPLAEPGGICISRGAYEQIRDKLDYPFQDRGEVSVKNIVRQISVFAIGPEAVLALPDEPIDSVVAEAPIPIVATPAPAMRRRPPMALLVTGSVLVLALLAGGWWYWQSRTSASQTFAEALTATMVKAMPMTSREDIDKLVQAYQEGKLHRSLAMVPGLDEHRWTADWPSRDVAEEQVLEKCQMVYGAPCAVIASDDAVIPPDANGGWSTRDMPRVRYAGLFTLDKIPGMRPKIFERPDVAGYATATGPKAIAIHPQGVFMVVTEAATQHAAEEQALQTCNEDPARKKADRACLLYASGNQVVLPLRKIKPMTP
jgi:class 3 adenylate cyclase